MSRRSLLIIIIVAVVALIAGLIAYSLIPRASILLSIAPEEFTVTYNGSSQNVTTGKKITVTPGDVSVSISRDGFETSTKTVTIKNGENQELLLALVPKTDAARALLETEKSQQIIQRIANINMKNTTAQYVQDYPIFSVLPIKDKFYVITSCESRLYPNDKTKVAICVNLFDMEAKQSAIEDINRRGFSVDDYEIYYDDKSYDPSAQAGDWV